MDLSSGSLKCEFVPGEPSYYGVHIGDIIALGLRHKVVAEPTKAFDGLKPTQPRVGVHTEVAERV
jgi:hypothetical protein